jgi:hypothetical protein
MASQLAAQHISITINRPFDEVNDFLAPPANFEQWAAGLGNGFQQVNGDEWTFKTGDGTARIRFTGKNSFGVADHWVFPQPSVEVYVPLRAVANGDGSEVTLTLFRQPEMTDEQFAADRGAVQRDLEQLKAILEA